MLATKEFIEKVESTGYKTRNSPYRIYIYMNEEELKRKVPCARVDHKDRFVMSCRDRLKSAEVFALITEYAQTPIDKREKEGRIWIAHLDQLASDVLPEKWVLAWDEDEKELFFNSIDDDEYALLNKSGLYAIFTEEKKAEVEEKTGVPLVFLKGDEEE